TEHPSRIREEAQIREALKLHRQPATARNLFGNSKPIIRLLFGGASVRSRSLAEGFSKPSRTLVEALPKDCRTTPEQQSNNTRRNSEEPCVCTHGMVPARSGLGLALGLMWLFLGVVSSSYAQTQEMLATDSIKPLQIGDTIP